MSNWVLHMSRMRLVLTAVAVVALAGLAAGLLVGRGSGASERVRSGLIASGSFHSVSWGTRGRASIVGVNGTAVLQLRGFQTQKAPELWIVLEGKAGTSSRRQLGPLERAWGNQDYALPAAVAADPPARVLIYCTKCGKVWGYAPMTSSNSASNA
jgi:Electron transfer DM13